MLPSACCAGTHSPFGNCITDIAALCVHVHVPVRAKSVSIIRFGVRRAAVESLLSRVHFQHFLANEVSGGMLMCAFHCGITFRSTLRNHCPYRYIHILLKAFTSTLRQ